MPSMQKTYFGSILSFFYLVFAPLFFVFRETSLKLNVRKARHPKCSANVYHTHD